MVEWSWFSFSKTKEYFLMCVTINVQKRKEAIAKCHNMFLRGTVIFKDLLSN